MLTEKINDTTYKVELYDWVERHDDYIAGVVKRNPSADEDSDERYWMFYPSRELNIINAGDLKRLSLFIAELNTGS